MVKSRFQDWIGRTESTTDCITPGPVEAMAATLNRTTISLDGGSPLPPLWHWLYFLHKPPTNSLGPDGHMQRGEFLPPITLPRRMWAGARVQFHQPLRLGQQAQRTSRILDVVEKQGIEKQGKSGPLMIVTTEHTIHGETGLAITEEQDLVYREHPKPGVAAAAASSTTPPPATPEWSHTMSADPVLLFRYSALTFNTHRIHYDQPYATGVEGYPGLVVHGPLIPTLLLEALSSRHPDHTVSNLTMRAMRPLFHGTPFRIQGCLSGNGSRVEMWSLNEESAVTMQATAGLVP